MPSHESARSFVLDELARRVGGRVRGDATVAIRGVATIDDATPTDLTWATDEHHWKRLDRCRAAAVIGPPQLPDDPRPAILVDDVPLAVLRALESFYIPPWRPAAGRDPTARIDAAARLDATVAVGPFCVVGPRAEVGAETILHAAVWVGADVRIGRDCVLWPGAFVGDRCRLGDRVVLMPHAAVGRDGFGFVFREGRHRRIPQIGTVEIGDDVEVGAGACVDRAKTGVTRIGSGTKIDNLVQIAHNVRTGEHCILVGQVGVSGSVRLGSGVMLGGQVGVSDGLEIGDGTRVTAQSGVTSSLPAGIVAEGKPARERMRALREQAMVRRLPELLRQVRELQQRVNAIETAADDRAKR